MTGIVPELLGGMSIAAVLLLGMWRNDKGHGALQDSIRSSGRARRRCSGGPRPRAGPPPRSLGRGTPACSWLGCRG